MSTIEQLKERGWHFASECLPDIVKGTAQKNYNPGKDYPVQIENWLESLPVLVLLKGDDLKSDNIRLARLTGLRMEFFDDDSGVKLDEEIEDPDWFVGQAGRCDDEGDFVEKDLVLMWRELDDLIPDTY